MKSDTLLLADIFENFRNNCIETYELDPGYFLSAPGLTREAWLKRIEVELELLTNPNMLLMFEDGIKSGITQSLNIYAEANNKCMTNYDKNKEFLYLMYLDINNLYGWAMPQKLPTGCFKKVFFHLSKIDEKNRSKVDAVFGKTMERLVTNVKEDVN